MSIASQTETSTSSTETETGKNNSSGSNAANGVSIETDPISLLYQMLEDQQDLTAVERFSQHHEQMHEPLQSRYYKELLPASPPGEGQQYAFEVDLDACSGCKACVAACHTMNGLDESEAWRDVGILMGGTQPLPVIQHVTTACHHCVKPGCMEGCPVKAYDKDPVTGIVKHLDDQCIGCQYCEFKCPYEVPKYNSRLGIVRKCDMCSDRLEEGEAPACVAACPNEAIKITVVDTQQAIEDCETGSFLPGAPDPQYTLPTTNYRTTRVMPRNMIPGDYHSLKPEHAHMPLVVMLVLTQLSVGAFVVEQIASWLFERPFMGDAKPMHATLALLTGFMALGASVFHLGRPLQAWRAFLGLGTSWLSREIIAFGVFAKLAAVYAVAIWLGLPDPIAKWSGIGVAVTGLLGVFSSVMVYHDTNREFWRIEKSGMKFFMSTAVLGIGVTLVLLLFSAKGLAVKAADEPFSESQLAQLAGVKHHVSLLAAILAGCMGLKLLTEASFFLHLRDRNYTPGKRSSRLLLGPLAYITSGRFATGLLGGFLPLIFFASMDNELSVSFASSMPIVLTSIALISCLVSEFLERYLFFAAVIAPKMPGAQS